MRIERWIIRWVGCLLLTLAGLVLSTNALFAQQSYEHAWFSVDVGSAVNSARDYSLRGVAGQADAGTLSRDAYSLTGGVLAFAAPTEQPGAPDQPMASTLFMPKLSR